MKGKGEVAVPCGAYYDIYLLFHTVGVDEPLFCHSLQVLRIYLHVVSAKGFEEPVARLQHDQTVIIVVHARSIAGVK